MRWLYVLLLVTSLLVVSRAEDELDVDDVGDYDGDDGEDYGADAGFDEDAATIGEDDGELPPGEDASQQEELVLPEERPDYVTPSCKGSSFLTETFDSADSLGSKWVLSQAKKDDADDSIAKYDGVWKVEEPEDNPLQGDKGLVLKTRAKHHAVAAMLDRPFEFSGKPLVVQYEVKFQGGQECGGAYIKLLSQTSGLDLAEFKDKTGYTIMFGPDKCGNDDKLHFIMRHKHPKTGEFEEKHAKKPSTSSAGAFTDKKTHLYTLVVNTDNMWEVYVDQDLVNSGSLLEDMTPPINPPKEITDPNDKKPESWDEREKIVDPAAVKPEDWDESEPETIEDEEAEKPEGWLDEEPELVADPDAEKPEDWDDDMDGEWEAPQVSNPACESAPGCGEWKRPTKKNPAYKGKWRAPQIDNPNYQGKWKAAMIPNPEYFDDQQPYKMTPIAALGLELWSMSADIMFDNFIVTDDKSVADQWAADTWELKHTQEVMATKASGRSVVDAVKDATNERPWLWAVFILVIVLPIVLIIYCCCTGGSSSSQEADAKKTDAVSPDDEPAAEEDTQAGGDQATNHVQKAATSKGDLEAEPEEEEGEASQEEQEASQEEGEDEEEKQEAPATPTRSSTRLRKARARKD